MLNEKVSMSLLEQDLEETKVPNVELNPSLHYYNLKNQNNSWNLSDEEYEIARRAVEDKLVELRDARIAVIRRNGLAIADRNGNPSPIIRMGIEEGIRIGLEAIAEHRKAKANDGNHH